MTSAAHASLASAAHTSLASAAHTSLAARYEQPSPPRFTAFGVDLERPGALELVTRAAADGAAATATPLHVSASASVVGDSGTSLPYLADAQWAALAAALDATCYVDDADDDYYAQVSVRLCAVSARALRARARARTLSTWRPAALSHTPTRRRCNDA